MNTADPTTGGRASPARNRSGRKDHRDSGKFFYSGEVWWGALCDFRSELHEHVEQAKKDQLRFQDGRLFRSLIKHIKAKATGKEQWHALFYCYRFATNTTLELGYDEARRLHDEEMKARKLSSACSFCSSLVESLDELLLRVRSIASWMEAQESFSLWLVFKDLRQGWRGDRDARARAIQALYLAKLPQRLLTRTTHGSREILSARFPEGVRVGTNYDGKPWTERQWRNILKQAAGLADKFFDCAPFEHWLWWCYPVFQRYRWNTREVRDAAMQRGFAEGKIYEANFRRRLMSMGLRIAGKRQDRTPPLSEFVIPVVLPDPGKMWGSRGGFLTKKKR